LKGKGHVQPSQDNRDHMVKKLEKGSIVTYTKLPQINLKTSYQKVDKLKIKKKAHVKSLSAQHWDISHLNVPTRKVIKQSPLGDKEAYLRECALPARKKGHNIVVCPKEEASKQICQNRTVRFGKPEYPVLTENF
jgi:hypothetical protein